MPALALTGACVLRGSSALANGSASNGFLVQVAPADAGPGPNNQDTFCTLDNSSRAYEAIVTVVCGTGAVVQVAPPAGWRGFC